MLNLYTRTILVLLLLHSSIAFSGTNENFDFIAPTASQDIILSSIADISPLQRKVIIEGGVDDLLDRALAELESNEILPHIAAVLAVSLVSFVVFKRRGPVAREEIKGTIEKVIGSEVSKSIVKLSLAAYLLYKIDFEEFKVSMFRSLNDRDKVQYLINNPDFTKKIAKIFDNYSSLIVAENIYTENTGEFRVPLMVDPFAAVK